MVLEPNITCTMEPLYMIPGRMGFHVEDMYRITPQGFEAITGTITPNDKLDHASADIGALDATASTGLRHDDTCRYGLA